VNSVTTQNTNENLFIAEILKYILITCKVKLSRSLVPRWFWLEVDFFMKYCFSIYSVMRSTDYSYAFCGIADGMLPCGRIVFVTVLRWRSENCTPSVVWWLTCLPLNPQDILLRVQARPRTVDFYG
jgi:hypothetical protein